MGRSKGLKRKRRYSVREIVSIILLISLVFSVVFSFVKFLAAPSEPTGEEYEKVKSDYLLMLVQCSVGLVVMCLPWIVSRKFNVVVPGTICILYYIFLYCAIFLGEVLDFYYVVPHWDTMLHAFSGAMLGALGFVLVDFLNKDSHVKVSLTPFFISLFAFSFALSIGALFFVATIAVFSTYFGAVMSAKLSLPVISSTVLVASASADDKKSSSSLSSVKVKLIFFFALAFATTATPSVWLEESSDTRQSSLPFCSEKSSSDNVASIFTLFLSFLMTADLISVTLSSPDAQKQSNIGRRSTARHISSRPILFDF